MKSFRNTYIFTAAVIAACAFTYVEVFKKGNLEAEKKEKSSQLYQLKADEITRIELSNGENKSVLQKTRDNWTLEKPVGDLADQTAVKNFIDTVLREKTTELVDEGEKINFKTYGLDQPAFELKLTGISKDIKPGPANLSEDVSFGSVKAYDGSEYIRYADQKKVYLAPSYLTSVLNKKASDFRNKNMFGTTNADVDLIKIVGNEKIEIRMDKEVWKFEQPKVYELQPSSETIHMYLDLLKNLKGTEIVADDRNDPTAIKKYHLDKPALILSIRRPQEPKDYQLKVSDPKLDKDHNVYMLSSDTSGIVKGVQSNLDTLNKTTFEFTEKKQSFTFGTANAEHIRISTTDFKADIKKDANNWMSVSPQDKRMIDLPKVEEILTKINHLEAKGLASTQPENLKNEIEVSDAAGTRLFKMNWGEPFDEPQSLPANKKSKDKSKSSSTNKLVYVRTSKFKSTISLSYGQIQMLTLPALFKALEPAIVSDAPGTSTAPKNPEDKSSKNFKPNETLDKQIPAASEKKSQ